MAGEFSISEFPIGEVLGDTTTTGGGGAPALGPGYTFPSENIKYRYGERYTSDATNKKFLGVPRGVYLGFTPSFSGNILTLSPDTSYGVSLARLTSQDDSLYPVDVYSIEPITLDFTGHTVFPVNVVLRASGALGQPHSAELFTKTGSAADPTEILVCVVTAIGTAVYDDPTNRDSPYAHASAPLGFGFMKDGAVEELLAAVALTTEIGEARTDLTGTLQSSLDTRLEVDSAAAAMGSRLGKEIRTYQGVDVTVAVTGSTLNVSSSFAASARAAAGLDPAEDIPGFATETTSGGVITSGILPEDAPTGSATDSVRNVCAVVDVTAGTGNSKRITDSLGSVAFGRLSLEEVTLSGELTFDGTVNVVGDGSTLFTSEIQGGDIIEAPNGLYYEVATTPIVNNALTLTIAPPSGVSTGLLRRRFTLTMLTRDANNPGEEDPYSVNAATDIRFFFPVWRALHLPQFTSFQELAKNHEETPVPLATTTIAGRALVATRTPELPEGKAGAVFSVFQGTLQRGQDHIHTIDFGSANLASPGVVDVTQRGATGPAGPDATGPAGIGPAGPAGPTGPGINVYESFVESSEWFYQFWPAGSPVTWPGAPHPMAGEVGDGVGSGGATFSYIVNFANSPYFWDEVTVATCGIAQLYNDQGSIFDNNDSWIVTDIDVNTVGGKRTEVVIDFQVPTAGSPTNIFGFKPFISAAGIT